MQKIALWFEGAKAAPVVQKMAAFILDTDRFSDREILAKTMYGEARNQGVIGLEGIAGSIVNRSKHPRWWGHTIRQICLAHMQYDCWMKSDPNRAVIMAVTDKDQIYASCLEIADEALAGTLPDVTNGADSYCRFGLVKDWNAHLTPTAIIKDHAFYKTI